MNVTERVNCIKNNPSIISGIYEQASKDKIKIIVYMLLMMNVCVLCYIFTPKFYISESIMRIELKKTTPILNRVDNGFYTIQKINTESDVSILKSRRIIELAIIDSLPQGENKNYCKSDNMNATSYLEKNKYPYQKKTDGTKYFIDAGLFPQDSNACMEISDKLISNIRDRLSIKESAKESGVLLLRFEWSDPILSKEILNSIMQSYVSYNIYLNNKQDSENIERINNQLPIIKNELVEAEKKLNFFYAKNKFTDYETELKILSNSMLNINYQLTLIGIRRYNEKIKYRENHPSVKGVVNIENNLIQEKRILVEKLNLLPIIYNEFIRLSKDVESWRKVYTDIMIRKQELAISARSKDSNVHIIDSANTLSSPVKRNSVAIITIGVIVVFFIPFGMVFLRYLVSNGVTSLIQLKR